MVVYFCGDQNFVDFIGFLSMIIYEVLYILGVHKVQDLQHLVFRYKNINLFDFISDALTIAFGIILNWELAGLCGILLISRDDCCCP